jgi:type IV pilus assembly protein PilV
MMKKISAQRGVGLIEVLITVLLISTALLALSSLQARSLQFNNSAYVRSQANIFAYDIIDRIRITSTTIAPNKFNIGFNDALPTGTAPQQVAVNQWRTNLANSIAGAKGRVDCNTAGFCTIQIRWAEQNGSGNLQEDESTFSYTVQL